MSKKVFLIAIVIPIMLLSVKASRAGDIGPCYNYFCEDEHIAYAKWLDRQKQTEHSKGIEGECEDVKARGGSFPFAQAFYKSPDSSDADYKYPQFAKYIKQRAAEFNFKINNRVISEASEKGVDYKGPCSLDKIASTLNISAEEALDVALDHINGNQNRKCLDDQYYEEIDSLYYDECDTTFNVKACGTWGRDYLCAAGGSVKRKCTNANIYEKRWEGNDCYEYVDYAFNPECRGILCPANIANYLVKMPADNDLGYEWVQEDNLEHVSGYVEEITRNVLIVDRDLNLNTSILFHAFGYDQDLVFFDADSYKPRRQIMLAGAQQEGEEIYTITENIPTTAILNGAILYGKNIDKVIIKDLRLKNFDKGVLGEFLGAGRHVPIEVRNSEFRNLLPIIDPLFSVTDNYTALVSNEFIVPSATDIPIISVQTAKDINISDNFFEFNSSASGSGVEISYLVEPISVREGLRTSVIMGNEVSGGAGLEVPIKIRRNTSDTSVWGSFFENVITYRGATWHGGGKCETDGDYCLRLEFDYTMSGYHNLNSVEAYRDGRVIADSRVSDAIKVSQDDVGESVVVTVELDPEAFGIETCIDSILEEQDEYIESANLDFDCDDKEGDEKVKCRMEAAREFRDTMDRFSKQLGRPWECKYADGEGIIDPDLTFIFHNVNGPQAIARPGGSVDLTDMSELQVDMEGEFLTRFGALTEKLKEEGALIEDDSGEYAGIIGQHCKRYVCPSLDGSDFTDCMTLCVIEEGCAFIVDSDGFEGDDELSICDGGPLKPNGRSKIEEKEEFKQLLADSYDDCKARLFPTLEESNDLIGNYNTDDADLYSKPESPELWSCFHVNACVAFDVGIYNTEYVCVERDEDEKCQTWKWKIKDKPIVAFNFPKEVYGQDGRKLHFDAELMCRQLDTDAFRFLSEDLLAALTAKLGTEEGSTISTAGCSMLNVDCLGQIEEGFAPIGCSSDDECAPDETCVPGLIGCQPLTCPSGMADNHECVPVEGGGGSVVCPDGEPPVNGVCPIEPTEPNPNPDPFDGVNPEETQYENSPAVYSGPANKNNGGDDNTITAEGSAKKTAWCSLVPTANGGMATDTFIPYFGLLLLIGIIRRRYSM